MNTRLLGFFIWLSTASVAYSSVSRITFAARSTKVNAYFSVKGLYSSKNIRLDTDLVTKYTSGFVYAADGVQTLGQLFSDPINVGHYYSVAQDGLADAGAVTVAVARDFFRTGDMPNQWRLNGNNIPATHDVMTRALLQPDPAQPLPNNKAYLLPKEREALASESASFDSALWGVRLECGLGFSVAPSVSVYGLVGYTFSVSDQNQSVTKNLSFLTAGENESFKSALGDATLEANLIQESFKYNGYKVLSDVAVSVSVKETFLAGGMLDWSPLPCLTLFAVAGVKRYALEARYEGGDIAFPGTDKFYSEDFLKENNRYHWLVAQKDVVRKFETFEWPFYFGAGCNIFLSNVCSVSLSVEYASFDVPLKSKAQGSDSSDEDYKNIKSLTEDPLAGYPLNQAVFAGNQHGVHQFAAKDVSNTLSARVSVQDFAVTLGCLLKF